MKTIFIVFLVHTIWIATAYAETVQQYRDRSGPFYGNTLETKKNPGGSIEEQAIQTGFVSKVSQATADQRRYDSELIAKITCGGSNAFMGFPARYKVLKWKIEGEATSISGVVQTDGEGYIKLQTQSHGSLQGARFVASIKSAMASFVLGNGPYDLEIDEADCR